MIWIVLGSLAIVLASVGAGVALDRRIGLLPRKPRELPRPEAPVHAPGEAPATAIRARQFEVKRLRSQTCRTCSAPLEAAGDERVSYDGRELLVLAFTCPRCDTKLAIYLDLIG